MLLTPVVLPIDPVVKYVPPIGIDMLVVSAPVNAPL